ncbi:hypothetical protein ACH4Y0_02805 [Streptomyces sp. NPDC020707]|uniref:hypothetical protein n=1 Tax=Streptomyces sp. NPDC020707 TaxID=3365084 RepID=UPI0037ADCE0F
MLGGVVGYTYAHDNLCPSCTIGRMRANGIKVARSSDHEEAVRRAAERVGVDFSDERSYDSSDFPQTITGQQVRTELTELPDGERGEIEDEKCRRCGKWLVLGEKSPSEAALIRHVRDSYELPQALARLVAATLREWGLSHPEFFNGDNVKQAAAQSPHDWASYRFVNYPKSNDVVPAFTPDHETEECVNCGRPWEDHTLICNVCKKEVPATGHHSHEIRMKGQRPFPGITKELTG